MKRALVLGFEKLLDLWQSSRRDISLCQLLGLACGGPGSASAEPYPVNVLLERFRETWWEVIWPNPRRRGILGRDVQCKYVADSFHDALRRCPHAEFLYVETADLLTDDDTEDETEEAAPPFIFNAC